MPNPVKGVLAEELGNSNRLLRRYQQALEGLPPGSLVAKNINGNVFYYRARRVKGRLKFDYLGKLSKQEVAKFSEVKVKRAQYRRLIRDLRAQIRFIQRALHERKRRSR